MQFVRADIPVRVLAAFNDLLTDQPIINSLYLSPAVQLPFHALAASLPDRRPFRRGGHSLSGFLSGSIDIA
jgi:hypothetical protein